MAGKGILLFMTLAVWISGAQAAVLKDVQFESTPPGAEVFLLRGTRQESLGTTPLKYQAEFHSQISILRFAVKKPGYETKTIEVNAQQERVIVNLTSKGFVADRSTIKDPILRDLQERLAPIIDRVLLELLAAKGVYDFELANPVRVTRLDDNIFLILSITLDTTKGKMPTTVQSQNEDFFKAVWGQLGLKILIPLGTAVRHERQLNGIVLDMDCSGSRRGFEVSSRLESRIEMECVPGTEMRQVYNPCVRQRMETYYDQSLGRTVTRYGGCEGGYEMQSVFNPCLTRVPVTRTQVKIDPKATTASARSRAQIVFPIHLIKAGAEYEKLLPQLGILLTNDQGEIIIRRGFVPSSLPKIPG